MKVLMIPSFFKDKHSSTLGSFFLDQAIALQKAGNEVIIIYPDVYSIKHLKDYIHYEEKNETICGVKIFRKKIFAPFKYKFYGYAEPFTYSCLKIIKNICNNRFDFDIIHAQNCIWAGYAALKISKKFNIPYVITEHSSIIGNTKKLENPVTKRKVICAYKNAATVISVSENLKKDMKPYTYNEPIVIGNIVDTEKFKPTNNKYEKRKFTFLFVAYLGDMDRVKLKGIEELINAFELLIGKKYDIKLKIVGVPKKFHYINNIIKNKELNEFVEIIEPLKREEIINQMHNSDCFAMLSKYETFGLVYAEAISIGLPTIATNVGITSEIISKDTGVICEKNDIEMISDSMIQIIKNKDNFLKDKMHNSIVEKYSENAIASKIIDVYKKVLSEDISKGKIK